MRTDRLDLRTARTPTLDLRRAPLAPNHLGPRVTSGSADCRMRARDRHLSLRHRRRVFGVRCRRALRTLWFMRRPAAVVALLVGLIGACTDSKSALVSSGEQGVRTTTNSLDGVEISVTN